MENKSIDNAHQTQDLLNKIGPAYTNNGLIKPLFTKNERKDTLIYSVTVDKQNIKLIKSLAESRNVFCNHWDADEKIFWVISDPEKIVEKEKYLLSFKYTDLVEELKQPLIYQDVEIMAPEYFLSGFDEEFKENVPSLWITLGEKTIKISSKLKRSPLILEDILMATRLLFYDQTEKIGSYGICEYSETICENSPTLRRLVIGLSKT